MLPFSRCILLALTVGIPGYALAADRPAEVKNAQTLVNEYRALRKACAITKGDQRKVCFSQLNDSTASYQKAKEVLAMK